MKLEELTITGTKNQHGTMAASIGTKLVELRKESIRECLSDFENVNHRLEFVTMIHGIEFINDSKATNINSVWYALESTTKPVIWIAGGIDKGNDYTKLYQLVKDRVKVLICLGLDNSKLIDAFIDIVPEIYETKSMHEAVELSYKIARNGDAVMLSPACASFDLFENYEDRGNQFKKAVHDL